MSDDWNRGEWKESPRYDISSGRYRLCKVWTPAPTEQNQNESIVWGREMKDGERWPPEPQAPKAAAAAPVARSTDPTELLKLNNLNSTEQGILQRSISQWTRENS